MFCSSGYIVAYTTETWHDFVHCCPTGELLSCVFEQSSGACGFCICSDRGLHAKCTRTGRFHKLVTE
jgi:hypothetical protein